MTLDDLEAELNSADTLQELLAVTRTAPSFFEGRPRFLDQITLVREQSLAENLLRTRLGLRIEDVVRRAADTQPGLMYHAEVANIGTLPAFVHALARVLFKKQEGNSHE